MPKGMQGVREAIQDIERRKSQGGTGDGRLWFKLPRDGDSAVVRFLEQGEDVNWAWMHELPPRQGQNWGDTIPCRDQNMTGEPCPGCQQGKPRTFEGYINLIWRDAPVFKKDAEGNFEKDGNGRKIVVGTKDQVAVWNSGPTVFEELDGKDVTYKGLMSRDFRVTRRGIQFNTRYVIEPANPDQGPTEMSAADKELAANKYDLTGDVTPPPFEEWGQGGGTQQQNDGVTTPNQASPFSRPAEASDEVSAFMKS